MTRHRFVRLCLAASLVLASLPALAIEAFDAEYVARYMGMQATGRMTLEPAGGDRWRYTLNVRNQLADLTQSTVFEERDGQLRPISGNDSNQVLIKKSSKKAEYDWSRGVATWSGDVKDSRAGPIKLQAGDLDALLVNLALVRDVQAGKPLRYRMVEDGRVKHMTYTVEGTENLDIGGKPRAATKLVNRDGDKRITVWVVDDLPVPARITRERKDEVLELSLKQVR